MHISIGAAAKKNRARRFGALHRYRFCSAMRAKTKDLSGGSALRSMSAARVLRLVGLAVAALAGLWLLSALLSEGGVAGDVHGLLTDRHGAAHDHVLDQARVDPRARHQSSERLGGQIGGVPAGEDPVPATDRSADSIDDHTGAHRPIVTHDLMVCQMPATNRVRADLRQRRRTLRSP